MQSNLRIYHTILGQIRKWFPDERVTRVRNLALFVTGLFLARKVHLSLITDEWHVSGKTPSLANRLRRFLSNGRISVADYYRPVAESLLSAFRGLPIRLIMDTTTLGFDARLLVVSIAYRKRALPLAWSVHRGKKGWVTVKEHIALLREVAALIPKGSEVWLLGDTEFQHVPLISWLRKQGWHYVLRQQGRIKVWQPGRAQVRFSDLRLEEGETRYLGWVRLGAKYHYGPVSVAFTGRRGRMNPGTW